MEQHAKQSDSLYTWSQHSLKDCQDANTSLVKQKITLQDQTNDMSLQLTATKENNTQLRKQLQALSAISSAQAESIQKSLDNIGAKDTYIRNLQSAVSHRDSINLAVLMELKSMLGGFGEDVKIKVEKGEVYLDLSDKLLFNSDSNSYNIGEKAKGILSRLARVITDQPNIDVLVEGHTDSVYFLQDPLVDNWDLSVKRATSVVRSLQNDYNISPLRMTAAGRGEYGIIAGNDTPEGRAANRRTRVVIIPHAEQLEKLLDHKQQTPDSTATAQTVTGN